MALAQNSTEYFKCAKNATNNYFLNPEYACRTSFFQDDIPLPVWVGWVILLGFGAFFGLLTVGIVYLETAVSGYRTDSEYFNTAGRTVKLGLTASVIVSQWTWAATLLQSSNVAFKFGVSGPFWYASGATIQVLLFSVLAVLVKRRAPSCHTFLEIVLARWGKPAHAVFVVFAFLTNIIVTSMLILGGSATINALTGINTDLASFLIPLGVILYTLAGGLKATFIASYFNTSVILVSLCIFIFQVYVTGEDLGSIKIVHERLEAVAEAGLGVKDNLGGSYLTILSRNGFFFGLTNIVGNFGTVFVDQAYWQSAIAATPSASWKGYLLGGLCWFSIPFSLATSLGLAAVALSLPITVDEGDKGLVPPAVAEHLLGRGGAWLILIMLFMAVTSTGAAEQIAVSSLVAYDVYRTYINPKATGRQIVLISRVVILVFGLLMGVLGIILNQIGVNLGWLYLFMGVLIGSAVFPVAFSISWSRCSGTAAISGAVLGLIFGLTSWLAYGGLSCSKDGCVTVDNLSRDEIMLTGNLVSILSSGAICIIVSLIWPDKCDWSSTKSIALIEHDENAELTEETEKELERAMKLISVWGFGLTIVLVILWPVLMIPAQKFSLGYFTFWVILSFIWGLLATIAMLTIPAYELVTEFIEGYKNRNTVKGKEMGTMDDDVKKFDTEKAVTP